MRNFLKKITAYTWAIIALVALFFTVGFCTLGNLRNTGDSLYFKAKSTAYFSLSLDNGEKLDSVYINVGEAYNQVGESMTLTLKTSDSATSTSWTAASTVDFSNLYSETGTNGGNYNYVALATSINKSVVRISLHSDVAFQLNEIVCLNANGEIIPLGKPSSPTGNYDASELAKAYDAQKSFNKSNSAYYNLTTEEGYYMSSVQNVLGGSELIVGNHYVLDTTYNYLATVLMTPAVAVFGTSAFAIRLPALLAACALLVFAYMLLLELTKSEKLSFIFSVVLALGGMLVVLGRLGAPYMMIASALVVSLYFMYRFFSRGIPTGRAYVGGLNVLLSGVFAAFALAMDITALIPVGGILVLFGFGLARQKRAYELAFAKTEGQEETVLEKGEEKVVNKAAEKATAVYQEKNRIAYAYLALSFGVLTLVLLMFGAIVCSPAYMKATDGSKAGFLTILVKGLVDSARGTMTTEYLAGNSSIVFAWFLPIKAATLLAGGKAGEYLAWNVLPNAIAAYAAFAAFIFATVKVVKSLVKKEGDKQTLRIRRTYFVLAGGMLAALVAGAVRGNVSAETGLLFHVFYLGFLPLAIMLLPEKECKKCALVKEIAIWTVVGLIGLTFLLSLPSVYGFSVSETWAKAFGWTAWLNNGFFR